MVTRTVDESADRHAVDIDDGEAAMLVHRRERAFTVDEYRRMGEVGIFREDDRVELIEGRIVEMSPIGPDHLWCVTRLTSIFGRRDDMLVSVQNPVHLARRSEPQPDLVVFPTDVSQDRTPGPADALLVVEVADSSLGYDRRVKAPLYARAGVSELWIADLGHELVEVYRDPSSAGYGSVRRFGRGERLSPGFAPELLIDVDLILGRPKGET